MWANELNHESVDRTTDRGAPVEPLVLSAIGRPFA